MSPRPDVVVVGSINADYLMRVMRRPEAGETISDAVLELHMGGKGANQAVAAARAGATTAFVGCVGNDAAGRSSLERLVSEGIDVSGVRMTDEAPTGVAFILLTPDGENSITVAPGANVLLTPLDADRASEQLANASVVVSQLEIPLEVIERAAVLAGPDTRVIVNCAPYRPLRARLLRRIDILVANAHEAELLSGCEMDQTSAEAVAERIVSLGPRAAIVTLGGDGAVVASGAGLSTIPADRVPVVDTTGSGDAFVGALAAALAQGTTLATAAAFGVRAGTATAQSVGPVPNIQGTLPVESRNDVVVDDRAAPDFSGGDRKSRSGSRPRAVATDHPSSRES